MATSGYAQENSCDNFQLSFDYDSARNRYAVTSPNVVSTKTGLGQSIQAHELSYEYIVWRVLMPELSAISKYNDTTSIKAYWCKALQTNANFNTALQQLYPTANTAKAIFKKEELFDIASRFFYCHANHDSTKIVSHICVGINDIAKYDSTGKYMALAGFAFETIFTNQRSKLIHLFSDNMNKILDEPSTKSLPYRDKLKKVENGSYAFMKQNKHLQKVLMKQYRKNRKRLGFEIR
jgi:hypothetical protein